MAVIFIMQPVSQAFAIIDDKDVAKISNFENIFANIVNVAGILLGIVFFLMMVMGGIRYLMSGGDPKALAAAKGTITWAIIGLAIFTLSFTILLLIKAFTGVDVTRFKLSNFI